MFVIAVSSATASTLVADADEVPQYMDGINSGSRRGRLVPRHTCRPFRLLLPRQMHSRTWSAGCRDTWSNPPWFLARERWSDLCWGKLSRSPPFSCSLSANQIHNYLAIKNRWVACKRNYFNTRGPLDSFASQTLFVTWLFSAKGH